MWQFREMAKGEDNVNPVQGEFFASQEIGDLGEVLIRESVQNSLDARRDKEDVSAELKITYGVSKNTLAELSESGGVFDGLGDHLNAEGNGLHTGKKPRINERVDYIAIEDFGTRGLNGDPSYDDTSAPFDGNDRNDFFFFWRNIGRSHKKKGELGSWGLGKHVFPAASRINSYFGLTIRSNDSRELLMGKSILKIHHVGGKKCAPYGYFGSFEASEFFSMPFGRENELEQFRNIFQLKRNKEPGLSVIVPFPKAPLLASPSGLVKAIVREYFYPILRGRLKIEIDYLGCEPIMVSADTVSEVAHKYLQDEQMLLQTIQLARWSTELKDEEYIEMPASCSSLAPTWKNIEVAEDIIELINEQIEVAGKVALRVPVPVKRKGANPVECIFDVCFCQTELMQRAPAKYIRQGIDVKEANKSKMDAGCIAIVRIQDNELGGMLRRSEPPAHNKWEQRNNEDLLDRYDNASSTITFVKNAPHEIWRIIMKQEMKQNRDVLRDIFYLDMSDLSKGRKAKSGNSSKKKEQEEGVGPTDEMIKMVKTTQLVGEEIGFVVRPHNEATHCPSRITIKTGYRPLAGSAIKKYSPHDFRLNRNPINVQMSGVEKEECRENILSVAVSESDFEIKVTGFDSNRDLVVNVIPERSEAVDDSEV
jgi:hypothetical protein